MEKTSHLLRSLLTWAAWLGMMEELGKTSQIDSTKPELRSACLVMYGGPSNIELRPSSRYIRAASSLLSCTALNVGG